MLGKIEELLALVQPDSRLYRGLAILRDCQSGRRPEVVNQLSTLTLGENRRLAIDGDDAFYMLIQCYEPKRRAEGRFEAHARHSDLQYVWSGREYIKVCHLQAVQPKPTYDANGNTFFPIGDTAHSQLLLQAGEVAVLFPEDAHAPGLRANNSDGELVRKLVVKIQDAHLPAPGPN